MKDMYIKPEIELKEFDILDIITTSPGPGSEEGAKTNDDDDWSGFYGKAGRFF